MLRSFSAHALLLTIAISLCLGCQPVGAQQSAKGQPPAKDVTCQAVINNSPGLSTDDSSNVQANRDYESAVSDLLLHEDFATLDCLADEVRTSKARFSGGTWKIHLLNNGLSQLQQHATEEDWQAHLKRLQRWIAAKPDSIAAHIALAESYLMYAWDARGGGTSETVSDSGWKLFEQRIAKAQDTLNAATKLKGNDPEWFLVQQQIGMNQGWEPSQMMALLKAAKSFEPNYYYYYRVQAAYLLPKWHGEEGDTAKFAEQVANQLGGDDGDIAYFQIAVDQICHCGDEEVALTSLSWPRIQKGFAAMEAHSGPSLFNQNQAAFMATMFDDSIFADKQFQRLGDRWSDAVWHTHAYYEQCRKSAAEIAPVLAAKRKNLENAAGNLATDSGRRYQVQVQKAMEAMVKECADADSSDLDKFSMTLRIGTTGDLEKMTVDPTTHLFNCVVRKMYEAQMAKKPRLPQAPSPSFWVKVDLDPRAVVSAAQGK